MLTTLLFDTQVPTMKNGGFRLSPVNSFIVLPQHAEKLLSVVFAMLNFSKNETTMIDNVDNHLEVQKKGGNNLTKVLNYIFAE